MRLLLLALTAGAFAAPAANAASPIACFTQSPANPTPGQTVTFNSSCSRDPDSSGRITNRAWDIDNDGSYDDNVGAITVTRTFATAGTYTIKLGVIDDQNNIDTETQTVTVNNPPTASFTNTPAAPTTGQLVTFNSTSTDSDGSIAAHAWDTDNDGSFDDGTGSSASRTFTTPGSYTVRLRVTDNRGAQTISSRSIAVANRGPTASFTDNAAGKLSGESITFTSNSTDPDGTIASHAWDTDNDGSFDDGTATTASRSFATSGNHTVRLRVTDNSNAENIVSRTIAVGNRAPVASFTDNSAGKLSAESITFTSNSTDPDGTIASYAWALDADGAFNDGTTSAVSRSFTTSGTHTIKLRVTDNSGVQTISTRTITVGNRRPNAGFGNTPGSPATGQAVRFFSTSTDPDGTIATYQWALDADGAFNDGTGNEVTRTFTTPGDYLVKLRVTDNSGTENISTRTITVGNREPVASFTFSPHRAGRRPDGHVDLDGGGRRRHGRAARLGPRRRRRL